jgi:signal transduction histidine kinase
MTPPGIASSVRGVRRVDLRKLDVVVAFVTTVGVQLETWLSGNASGHRVAGALVWLPVTAAVAVRRRRPELAGGAAIAMGILGQTLWPTQILSSAVAWMCDIYAFSVWTRRRVFTLGLAVYLAGVAATLPVNRNVGGAVFFTVVSVTVMLLVRVVIGDRERRASVAERERDLVAREAVVEERARIARELHDAIAHNVSMMVVQAGAERRVLDEEQASTREVLQTVEEIGRGALTEMRRLVGMLRDSSDEPLAPQPGLGDLPRLATQMREAGLPVDLVVEGDPRDLPVGLELSAYRIVQEALTNALKHAGDARASVRIRYGPESLELEIVDDGSGAATRVEGGGHGLVGMRERVALYGGRFEAARRPSGGFTVRALLPIR